MPVLFRGAGTGGDTGDFSDFESLFGHGQTGGNVTRLPNAGRDQHAKVIISLADA
jgi:hypothetical protein